MPPIPSERKNKCREFFIKQHLPIGLIVFTTLGFVYPPPGILLGTTPINVISLATIFFITGLQLLSADVFAALRTYREILH